jgi:hypothetical protein
MTVYNKLCLAICSHKSIRINLSESSLFASIKCVGFPRNVEQHDLDEIIVVVANPTNLRIEGETVVYFLFTMN